MKKLLLLLFLFFGLIPIYKNGKLKISSFQLTYAQTWGEENNGSYNIYKALSDYYGMDIIGSHTNSNGIVVFDLANGDLFYGTLDPVEVRPFIDAGLQDLVNDFPDIDPITLPSADSFNSFPEFLIFYNAFRSSQSSSQPPPPPPSNPCDQASQNAGTAVNTLYDNAALQNVLNSLYPIPISSAEQGTSITQDPITGQISSNPIESGGPNGLSINIDPNAIADIHTHPNSNYPPSATDIKSMVDLIFLGDEPNLQTSYVITNDGTLYALQVTDPSLITAFYNNMTTTVNPNTNNYYPNSSYGNDFRNVYEAFLNQGENERNSFERAMAYTLRNSGITLLKAESVSPPALNSAFKKIGVEAATNSNGNTVYIKSDCLN